MSVAAVAASVREGAVSPVELVRELLAARRAIDGTVGAFVSVDEPEALELAERCAARARAGGRLGPLHGVPFAVKDMIDVRGWATRAHSRVPVAEGDRRDAAVVARLRRAGAIPIGKLALEELGIEPAGVYARCGALIQGAESYAVHRRWLTTAPHAFGPAARRALTSGAAVSAAEYAGAVRLRRVLRRRMAAACERDGIDLIATGVTPGVAWRIGDARAREEVGAGDMRMTFNVLGYPAMALPIGFSAEGLPLSMQLAARPGQDRLVLDVGRAYELACGHSSQGGVDVSRHP
jgi:Asp-tRNA(Asn)/Glu-tRNA(Gln) amidotransferase A subunit family amidase